MTRTRPGLTLQLPSSSSDELNNPSKPDAMAAQVSHFRETWQHVSQNVLTHQPTGIALSKEGTSGLQAGGGLADAVHLCIDDLQYDEDNIIGRGRSSLVYKATHKATGMVVAIKEINFGAFDAKRKRIDDITRSNRNQLSSEMTVYIELTRHNPSLVQFYGAFLNNTRRGGCVYFVLEYMHYGSLDRIIQQLRRTNRTCIEESLLKFVAFQILDGLVFLHHHKRVHRDVKPHNVLINEMGSVKLSDFGICRAMSDSADDMTFVGTRLYMSPERSRSGYNAYSYPADIWGFGVVLAELACMTHPFPNGILNAIAVDDLSLPEGYQYSDDLRDLLLNCLQVDPEKRLSAKQLMAHRWLQEGMCSQQEFQGWLRELYSVKVSSSEPESDNFFLGKSSGSSHPDDGCVAEPPIPMTQSQHSRLLSQSKLL